jgi:hypothetical protein
MAPHPFCGWRDHPTGLAVWLTGAPASLILRLAGFFGLCETSMIGVLRNLAALLRRYHLQRPTLVPEFAWSLGSLGIFLLHS